MDNSLKGVQTISQRVFSHSVTANGAASSEAFPNGRVMLIDGSAIIYRAYYKLLGTFAHTYVILYFF